MSSHASHPKLFRMLSQKCFKAVDTLSVRSLKRTRSRHVKSPTYFSSAAIEGSNFVDGAIGANNPVTHVEEEAADIWCETTGNLRPLVKCFVSIVTGHPGIRSVSDKSMKHLIQTLQKEATETEATNQQFEARWREYMMNGRCFRFNVSNGLEDVKLAEYEEQELIRQATVTYLEKRETIGRVVACAENLRKKEYRPTSYFVKQMNDEATEPSPRPGRVAEVATASEIAELISLGNTNLKTPSSLITTAHLLRARHYFSKALHFLRNNPSTSPKQVSRVCQKLTETLLLLSQMTRPLAERKDHADQAQSYGEAALENVVKAGDPCMVAQVEFLLACVTAWKVYLRMKSGEETASGREGVRMLMERRLDMLSGYGNLQIDWYEEQAKTYLGYLG
ncbi:hypothetical protein DE146DRAFT_749720 [Phaeosphaeria sp. MPI-PUGE-AT-0046c]|nr:hypothetical protein DE146DRAFT_749720 [Phaeosphaeria sp. MPI-PUGE-AT-0046c]